jgi:hypothetical protein
MPLLAGEISTAKMGQSPSVRVSHVMKVFRCGPQREIGHPRPCRPALENLSWRKPRGSGGGLWRKRHGVVGGVVGARGGTALSGACRLIRWGRRASAEGSQRPDEGIYSPVETGRPMTSPWSAATGSENRPSRGGLFRCISDRQKSPRSSHSSKPSSAVLQGMSALSPERTFSQPRRRSITHKLSDNEICCGAAAEAAIRSS